MSKENLYQLDVTQVHGLMGAIDNAGEFTEQQRTALFEHVTKFLTARPPCEHYRLDGHWADERVVMATREDGTQYNTGRNTKTWCLGADLDA